MCYQEQDTGCLYIVEIGGNRIFSQQDAIAALRKLYNQGRDELSITFALERKLNAKGRIIHHICLGTEVECEDPSKSCE